MQSHLRFAGIVPAAQCEAIQSPTATPAIAANMITIKGIAKGTAILISGHL
jgi:hypothetical protein